MTIALALLFAASAQAPAQPARTPSEAARDFTLDGLETPAPDATMRDDASTTPAPDATTPDDASVAAAPAATEPAAGYTLDTPIATLIADARARAVLDRDLPGLSTDKNLTKFSGLSLRRFQPLTGGQLDDKLLAKVAADLANVGSESTPPSATTRKKPVIVGR